ncbi:MAG: hypothetical protein M5U34_33855 [Chloroflexi bacterium]|nr:hypothetical protein [Chloroflexota bacterium]
MIIPEEVAPHKIAYIAQSAFANDFTLVEYYGVLTQSKKPVTSQLFITLILMAPVRLI